MTENPWIKWEGQECPVDPEARVCLRSQGHGDSRNSYRAAEVQWDNSKRQIKLLAYRVVPS